MLSPRLSAGKGFEGDLGEAIGMMGDLGRAGELRPEAAAEASLDLDADVGITGAFVDDGISRSASQENPEREAPAMWKLLRTLTVFLWCCCFANCMAILPSYIYN